jgi:hypothetical protein
MAQFTKIVVIPTTFAWGDSFALVSLLYFLLEYYETVYYYNERYEINGDVCKLLVNYFSLPTEKNKRIVITDDISNIDNEGLHFCNLCAGVWDGGHRFKYSNFCKDMKYFFNDLNPLYNVFDINEKWIFKPNRKFTDTELAINHIICYQFIGLNNNIRLDYFNYDRDYQKELEIQKYIFNKLNIADGEKYNIVHNPINVDNSKFFINNYKIINTHNLVEFPGWLMLLIENAETIHVMEGVMTNFIYQCQYKNIIKLKSDRVFFHVWLRNRHWFDLKMDYSWKMMSFPKLENWTFIFSEDEARSISSDCH